MDMRYGRGNSGSQMNWSIAHDILINSVDECYRKAPFTNEPQRVAYLFELYERYAQGLLAQVKPKARRKAREKKG